LAVGVLMFATANALPAPAAKAEIDYLLSAVASSKCEFYRNGSWYDAKSAADHLTTKYKYLAARDLVQSAEEFIEKAATRSSLSGRDYAIRCGDGAAVASSRWLLVLLVRYRESHADALRRN
jgi:hypothetical protein